jgi:crotonobetainyl-CoA:carnitine CoA-transferase CaiB-like acyl-CoA transferase
MIAELAAFNAAYGVLKEFIGNGKDLSDCFGQIGQMTNAKEDLKARQQKNKKSLFASDAEEFMALEQIKKAEAELQDFMVYYGRAGLWDDFMIFQAKARKARLEAKNEHAQKINQRMHYAGLAVSCVLVCVGLYACFKIIYAIVK